MIKKLVDLPVERLLVMAFKTGFVSCLAVVFVTVAVDCSAARMLYRLQVPLFMAFAAFELSVPPFQLEFRNLRMAEYAAYFP